MGFTDRKKERPKQEGFVFVYLYVNFSGKRAYQGRAKAMVRVPGERTDICQGKGQHDCLPIHKAKRKCYQNVLDLILKRHYSR